MPLVSVLQQGFDRLAVSKHLALYKERGVVSYNRVLRIPFDQRIPEIVKQEGGKEAVLIALTAAIGSALKNIRVKQGMDEEQIVELALMIIDESHDDYLGVEDVLLFLQGLLLGKYGKGKIYERLDCQKFFEIFEEYRTERHNELVRFREEQALEHKNLPLGLKATDVFEHLKPIKKPKD